MGFWTIVALLLTLVRVMNARLILCEQCMDLPLYIYIIDNFYFLTITFSDIVIKKLLHTQNSIKVRICVVTISVSMSKCLL